MSTTLILLGIAVIVAAAGASIKAFGFESTPSLLSGGRSWWQRWGVVIIVAGVIVSLVDRPESSTSSEAAESPGSSSSATTSDTGTPPGETPTTTSPALTERYVPLFTDVALTMPAAEGCADASVGVTFSADGPKVETGIATGNVGNPAAGDIFYANCTDSGGDNIYVPDENPFTRLDGDPDPAQCAQKANAEPIGKSVPGPTLQPSMGFCLISLYNNVIVHLTITGISGNRDLAWTATAWLDTDNS